MGPTRTAETPQQGESSSTGAKRHSKRKSRTRHSEQGTKLPGVQKIKSVLRQAQRLLAKEKLAADVRVETERRIKALEADLTQARTSRKERDLAVRYHKVKFFERQKVVRKLNQTKKRLDSATASSSKAELDAAIGELRIDLNYVLHYPKTKKYISLFPPEIRQDLSSATPIPKVNPVTEEVRNWIKARMESGELSTEPELHLDSRGQERGSTRRTEWHGSKHKPSTFSAKEEPEIDEPEDAFFGDDAEEGVSGESEEE